LEIENEDNGNFIKRRKGSKKKARREIGF